MKNHYFNILFAAAGCVLLFNQSCSVAQHGALTSKTALASDGYTVMNPNEAITIYKYVPSGNSAKAAGNSVPKYYFTTASSDVLTVLSRTNLKNSFSTNDLFNDAIDANFTNDNELIKYDDVHKMYKINRLLQNDSSKKMNKDSSAWSSSNKNWDGLNKNRDSSNWDSSNKNWDSSSKNRDSSNHKNWDSSNKNRDSSNWNNSTKNWDSSKNMNKDSSNHKHWDSSNKNRDSSYWNSSTKNWDSSHQMNKDNSKTMYTDSSLMSSMNTFMDNMHNMKTTADFDHDFAHMMIKHHQAAINMSEIVMAKGTDTQVRKMAQSIITEHKVDIAQLELFIKNHKVTDGQAQNHLGKSMKSMMEKMNSMKMTGNIDKDYVMMMIPHREYAVAMAEAQLAHGKKIELKKMAQTIISGQKKEIAEFNSWKSVQK